MKPDEAPVGWAAPESLFVWLRQKLPPSSKILEFGSGFGTKELTKTFDVISVEHDPEWLGVCEKTTYIHAPIVDNWYDWKPLENLVSKQFSALLIDGPPKANAGRVGAIDWLCQAPELFNNLSYILVDDGNDLAVLPLVSQLKSLGWQLIHHDPGTIENGGHNWSVFQKTHECPNCAEEFSSYQQSLQCCA